jgi:hypothetical protein
MKVHHLKNFKMKKTLFTTAFFLIFTATSFAGGNSNKKTNLFKELSAAMSSANQTVYKTTDAFKGTYFTYNNKTIHAFHNIEDGNLIGFSIPLSAADLPAGIAENIQQKFSGWKISEAIMFIQDNTTGYYVSVTKDKEQTLILKLNATGKPFIYAKM